MSENYHRHDLDDHQWSLIEPLLPGQKGQRGRPAQDNRQFINAVFWILRTGAPWRDLPSDYGDWKNTHRRFTRWRDKNIWENILEQLIDEPDYEWLMIDASHIKLHHDATGAVGGTEAAGLTKGGSTASCIWPWMRLVCHSDSLSRKVQSRMLKSLINS